MNAPVQIEGAAYRPDGSAIVRLGQLARLDLQILGPVDSGPMVAQDLDGRHFVQRILDRDGSLLIEVEASHPDETTVRFELAVTEALLPADAKAADLTHVLVELLEEDQEDEIAARPFSIRRLRAGAPDATLSIGPPDRLAVRYVGAPGASAAQLVRDAGLIETPTGDALAAWLRQPAVQAAEAADAIVQEWAGLLPSAQAIYDAAQQVAEDRQQTGEDRQAVAADRQQTGQDREATGQDRLATGQDRVVTGQDRGVTTSDRIASQLARDLAQQHAADAALVSGVYTGLYSSRASFAGAPVPAEVNRIQTMGYASPGDGGGGWYRRCPANPNRPYASVQDSAGVWWELDEQYPHSRQYGIVSLDDMTARFKAMIDESKGKIATLKRSLDGQPYYAGLVDLSDAEVCNTLVIESGVEVQDRPSPMAASPGFIRVRSGARLRIFGFGAKTTFSARATGSTINASGAALLEIYGLDIDGSGPTKDCLYVGGNDATGTKPSTNVYCRWVSFRNARRNCISVVEGNRVVIEDFLVEGAIGAPGAGIDIEANRFSDATGRAPMQHVRFRRGIVRNNQNFGVVHIFGDDVEFEDVDSYDNGEPGFGSGAGGANFDNAVVREGLDVCAIEAFGLDGWITVPAAYWANIEIGTLVLFRFRNGAARPPELNVQTYYLVHEKDATGTRIRVSTNSVTAITALSNTGTGNFTSDRFTSDHYLMLYQDGSCSKLTFKRCRAWGNNGNTPAGDSQFEINTAVNVLLEECEGWQTGNYSPFKLAYSRNVKRRRCTAYGDQPPVATNALFSASLSSEVEDVDLKGRNAKGPLLGISSVADYRLKGGRGRNCGSSTAFASFDNLFEPLIEGLRGRGDPNVVWQGISATANVINGRFRDIDVRGLGTSDSTSLNLHASSITHNCVLRSGVLHRTGSKTHDFGVIGPGAFGTSTAIAVTGGIAGAPCIVESSIYTAGLLLHGVYSSANLATVTPQNISAAPIPAQSRTLTVSPARIA